VIARTRRPADARPDDTLGPATTAFLSPRRELRGWGRAAVIDLPAPWVDHVDAVAEVLDAVEAESEIHAPGTGPVAFGALPFDRTAPARLVVPARVSGVTPDGDRWVTVVGDEEVGAHVTAPWPDRVELRVAEPADEWCGSVVTATKRIAAGDLTKVVLAREVAVVADVPLDPAAVAARLFDAHPAALRFCVDGFVGASPELLVSRVGDVVRAQPMAGTTPRSGDPDLDARRAGELLSSAKNRREHQITIDVVHDTLLPWCSYLDAEPEPSVAPAGSVQHLATMVEGRLSHPAPSVLDLVAALHPTPAVGGWPREPALELLAELEPRSRGRYAGPVGWVDGRGNGAFAVGIRSIEIDGACASVFAGVGVVADSDPRSELEETRAKLRATLPSLLQL
jgi:menaquinone-specific isochorismate synthase